MLQVKKFLVSDYQTVFLLVIIFLIHAVSPFIIMVTEFTSNGHCTVSPHMNESVVMCGQLLSLKNKPHRNPADRSITSNNYKMLRTA